MLFASNTTGVRSAGPLQKGSREVGWASSEFCDSDFKSKLGLSSRGVLCVWCLGNGSIAGACGMLGGGSKRGLSQTSFVCPML